MANSNNRILSGLGWVYGERILAEIVTLLVSIVLSRILTPEHYGTVAIVTVFITICNNLVTGGFGNALVQKRDSDELDFNSICWLSIGIALALYLILFQCAPFIGGFYGDKALTTIIRVMSIRVVFSAFNSVQQAYVQKKMIFRKFFFATIGGTFFSGVLGIAMAFAGAGVWALVGQYMSNAIINTLILFITIDWKPKLEISWKRIKLLWNFGSKVLASTMVYTIKDNIRSLIIGKRFSSSDLGYYNQGQKFPSLLVSNVVEALGRVLFPALSEEQNSLQRVKNLTRKSIKLSSFVLTPMIIGLFAVADTFIELFLTAKWLPCVPYLRILCIVYITRSMSSIFQKALLAIGKSNVILYHEIITSIGTIALLFVAVFIFDSIDLVAWSYVVVMLIGIIYYVYFAHRCLCYKYFEILKDFSPSLFVSCLMGIIVVVVGSMVDSLFFRLFLQVFIGIAFYISLSFILKDESLQFVVKFIREKLNSQRGKGNE